MKHLRHIALACIFAINVNNTIAATEPGDSGCCVAAPQFEAPDSMKPDPTHTFHWEQFAIPGAVTVASALLTINVESNSMLNSVQDNVAHKSKHSVTSADNYLQYLPAAEVFAANLWRRGEHGYGEVAILMAMSYATFSIANNALKYSIKEPRPTTGFRNSFPSGHTGTAFAGAEILRREFWATNKCVALSGYAVALSVAYLRLYNNRHWLNDVVAGAAIGYMSTTFAYWLYPKVFRKFERNRRRNVSYVVMPAASTQSVGLTCLLILR